MRIAVLSNINIDPLKPFLPAGEHYFGAYARYMEEIRDRASAVNTNPPDVLFLHLEGEEFIKEITSTLVTYENACAAIDDKLHLLFDALKEYKERHKTCSIILSNVALSPFNVLNDLDGNSAYSLRALEGHINTQLTALARPHAALYVMDWHKSVLAQGYQQIVDEKFWYLGRIKYNRRGHEIMAVRLRQMLDAIAGRAKKVLILDCDNTLWGGVIGEDGLGGLKLSEDDIGKAYRDFQQAVRATLPLGILLAICSKNNPQDVDEVFTNHPMMILSKDDFACVFVNWNTKVENIKAIAQQLNVGLDACVFIEDDARERALIRQHLPEVIVPEFPADPVFLKKWFLQDVLPVYFPKVFLTPEDTQKHKQYQAQAQRTAAGSHLTAEELLKELNIEIQFYCNDARFIQRTAQMSQKTNQFNMTTRRYTEAHIKTLIEGGDALVFNFDYRDKFGQEGIVGAAIVLRQGPTAYMDSLLMSCRVIGRQAEQQFLIYILSELKRLGVSSLTAEFIPTSKNAVAQDFYKNAGFTPNGGQGPSKRYILKIV
jgi:FkbH-like protein